MEQVENTVRQGKGLGVFRRLGEKDTEEVLYLIMCIITIPSILIFLLYLVLVEHFMYDGLTGCLLRDAFHLYCPGCGGTRAIRSLASGDLLRALYYHTPAVYAVFVYVIFFVTQTAQRLTAGKIKGMKFRPAYLWIMLVLVLVNFIVRNVLLVAFHIPTL